MLLVRGVAKPETAAFITSIANTAHHLDHTQENKMECPTITVEFDNK
jgi:hepatitis B virus X-interacting protein